MPHYLCESLASRQELAGVSPSAGPTAGGNTVTISGQDLCFASAVDFGSQPAASYTVDSSTQITAVAPAGTPGTVDVTVTVDGNTSATSAADQYTYVLPPTVIAVSPMVGPTAGGNTVTVTGTNFAGATAVEFGTAPATSFTVAADGTRLTAVAPAAATGTVNITVITPGGTSVDSAGDGYTYAATVTAPAPTVTAVSPTSGPAAGGTTVTVTGTNLTGASAVRFGTQSATSFTGANTQLTAVAPAGTGTVDVTVTTGGGTSATSAADRYTFVPPTTGGGPTAATVTPRAPSVLGSTAAGFAGEIDPNGSATTALFEYGLDQSLRTGLGPNIDESLQAGSGLYDQITPVQTVGSDFSEHQITAQVTGLIPNALYHVRLVAANAAGTVSGPDQTFTTAKDPPPPPPILGKTFDAEPVSGHVFIKLPSGDSLYGVRRELATNATLTKGAGFLPLTEPRSIPTGSLIDSRAGTLMLVTAPSKRGAKQEHGTFNGAIFGVTQASSGLHKGLTTLALTENAFPGAPSYTSCRAHTAVLAQRSAAGEAIRDPFASLASSSPVLQTLHAKDNHGKFRTRGHDSAGTVRGTIWDTSDRCDGTLTTVHRGTVAVFVYATRKTVLVHAGHKFLARPRTHKHKQH